MRVLLGFLLSGAAVVYSACGSPFQRAPLSAALTDEQFRDLTSSLSEPAGAFTQSDNLVSNEIHAVHTLRLLRPAGGVYVGVGPEQNFSYIARLRPEIAFIVDIRRENRNLHLMYKALFELSADRADFMSRLFSRERPAGLGPQASARELFAEYRKVGSDDRLYETNARLIRDRLLKTHRFPLTPEDLAWIEYAFRAFYTDGPDIHYDRSRPGSDPGPSYEVLMTALDVQGESRSYLATEEGFAFVKDLEAANRIVPVVGDFAGPDALRRLGDYIRQHRAALSAFYGSNVEVYLSRAKMQVYCGNLALLPYGSRTWYIGAKGMQPFTSKLKSCAGAAVR